MTEEFKEWWAYVLVSEVSGQTYVGVTVDVERRLQQHNGEQPGGAKSTHRGRPWKLAKKHGPFLDRGEAQTIEHQLKRQRGADHAAVQHRDGVAAHAHLALGTSITRPAAPTRPLSASRAPALPPASAPAGSSTMPSTPAALSFSISLATSRVVLG